MTVGIAGTLAQDILNIFRNVAPTLVVTPFIQLHTGDPGAAGTTSVSVGSTTRNAIVWAAATTAGTMALSTLSAWTNGGTSETITHVSLWTASTAGVFRQSFVLSAGQAWASTNTLTLTTFTVSYAPIAA
jgi:hypothetical protein